MLAAGGLLRRDRHGQSPGGHQNDHHAGGRVRRRRPFRSSLGGLAMTTLATRTPTLNGKPHLEPAAPPAIEALNISKRFGSLQALSNVSLKRKVLIRAEPTSVLTPDEADEVLGMLREMCTQGGLSVLMITHKFREVMAFCDGVTVLR